MPAPAIDAVLHELSGQIPGEILRETLNQSPYLDLPKVETHVEEMGKLQQILTYDRSLPANPITWTDITTSNGENGGACVPPAQSLQITQTLREWNLQHTALHSPYFCTNDLRDAMKAKDQMDQIFGILAENTAQVMIDRNRSEYTRLAGHKIICSLEDGLLDDDEWLAQEPTSILTGGMLKKVYTKLVRLGGQKCSYGTVDGRPSFLGIGGMEITERIFTEEAHRADVRESNRVPELLAPLGAERLFKGFWLTDDVFPPRWNLVEGDWVEVKPYVWSGGKLIDNPAYETATAEDYAQSGTRAPGESLEDFQIRQKSLTAQRIASNPDVIAAKDNTQKEAAAVAAGKTESERRANLPQGIAEAILNPDSGAVVGYTRKPLDLEQAGDTALKAKEGELRAKYGYKQGSGFPDAKSEEAFTKAFEETRLATRAGENDKALQAAVDAGTVDPTAASLVPTKTGFEATVVDAETGKVAIPLIKGPNMVGRDAKVSEMLTSGAAGVFQPDKNEINIGRSFSPIVTKAAGSGGYGVDTLPSPAKLAETLLHESGHAFVKANPGAIDIPAATPERTADYAKGFLAVVKGGTAPDAAKVGEEDFLQGDSLKRFSLGGVVSRAATGIAAGLTKPVFGPLTSAAPGFASINTPAPSGGSISDIFRNLMASTN